MENSIYGKLTNDRYEQIGHLSKTKNLKIYFSFDSGHFQNSIQLAKKYISKGGFAPDQK